MKPRYDIETLTRRLGPIRCDTHPAIVRQKSRDFYWYSPVLKRQLDHVVGDAVVSPADQEQVVEVLRVAHALGIPVTPRGSGTGNYGQAMPLDGGIVLSLSDLSGVDEVAPGRLRCGPGGILAEIDRHTRDRSGQELRMHPSTYRTASIGGFIAGGSSGVGSITWGGLRDLGNILGVTVATMEANPRLIRIGGADLAKVAHAYGTNGVITAVEMPLAPAYDWVDVILGFDSFTAAAAFANDLGEQDGILTKLVTVVAAPAPERYFLRHRRIIPDGASVVLVMVAAHALDAFRVFVERHRAARVLLDASSADPEMLEGLPPNYELSWNHTTLRALRVDPAITYLQVLYPFPDQISLLSEIHAEFGDEVMGHLEFTRFNGKITCFGLPLVRFTTEARLDEIVRIHEQRGAPIFNPHRYTLEEGGMKQTDAAQLAFKREADPQGLLNPGKMVAWDDPDFDFASGQTYLFPALGAAAR